MRIRKVSETPIPTGTAEIVDGYSTSTTNGYSCNIANKKFGGTILWTNPSPSSNFTGQINVDFSNVDAYSIIWATSGSGVVKNNTGIIPKGNRTELYTTYYDGSIKLRYRQVSAITNSTITFGDASENGSTNNSCNIPLYIIGYKTNLFD